MGGSQSKSKKSGKIRKKSQKTKDKTKERQDKTRHKQNKQKKTTAIDARNRFKSILREHGTKNTLRSTSKREGFDGENEAEKRKKTNQRKERD